MLEQAGPGTLDQQETAESPQIDSSPEMQNVTTLGESDTAQQPTPAQVASATEFLADKAPTAEKRADEPGRLVTPHPPVLRDDRPVSHLRYRNPAFHAPLLRSLWLPRDPLRAVDLGDTVNLHVAFVSSAGGRGIIGSWEDIERSSGDSGHDIKTGQTDDSLATVTSSATHDVGGSLSPPSLRRRRSSQGHQNDDDGLEHAALPPPALVVDPSLPLGPGASAGAATSVPLPASPATPLATGPPPSLQLFSAEESHARASGSPSTAPLASPTRSTHSTTMSRILSGASSAYSATSPTRTRARTRTTRSGSLATLRSNKTSLRARRESSAPIPESGEVEEGDPISSTEAMRNELLAEERRSHLVHAQRDELRKQKEREEADARAGEGKGGLWRKVLLWHDEGILGDDT
jgi:hypothetical protein